MAEEKARRGRPRGPTLPPDTWSEIRARAEAGAPISDLAKLYGVPEQSIRNRSVRGRWNLSDIRPVVAKIAAEKVAGIKAGDEEAKRVALIDDEAARVAELIQRHRQEVEAIRERLYSGLKAHRRASYDQEGEPISTFTPAGIRVVSARKDLALKDILAADLAARCLKNIHDIERRAWNIEGVSDNDDGAAPRAGLINIYIPDNGRAGKSVEAGS